MVHPAERFLGRTMLMVVGPATNDGDQQSSQHSLADRLVRTDQSAEVLTACRLAGGCQRLWLFEFDDTCGSSRMVGRVI